MSLASNNDDLQSNELDIRFNWHRYKQYITFNVCTINSII